jgi:hypothetical protein
MTAANAAAEASERGEDRNLPYWRTLKIDGYLNQKYPGGVEDQARRVQAAGHQSVGKGKDARLNGLERNLFRF